MNPKPTPREVEDALSTLAQMRRWRSRGITLVDADIAHARRLVSVLTRAGISVRKHRVSLRHLGISPRQVRRRLTKRSRG